MVFVVWFVAAVEFDSEIKVDVRASGHSVSLQGGITTIDSLVSLPRWISTHCSGTSRRPQVPAITAVVTTVKTAGAQDQAARVEVGPAAAACQTVETFKTSTSFSVNSATARMDRS